MQGKIIKNWKVKKENIVMYVARKISDTPEGKVARVQKFYF